MRYFIISTIISIFASTSFSRNDDSNLNSFENALIFGPEFTRSNYQMIFSSLKSIAKRYFLGKGPGVLDASSPTFAKYQKELLDNVLKSCPNCTYNIRVDSHGDESFEVTFPDNVSIIISVDAGTLEIQTPPFSFVDYKKKHKKIIKENIFDMGKKIGLNTFFDGFGGHVTFSGFGSDIFLYMNYLAYVSYFPTIDLGFFMKNSSNAEYNAKPFAKWYIDQRKKWQETNIQTRNELELNYKKIYQAKTLNELLNVFKSIDQIHTDFIKKVSTIYSEPKNNNAFGGVDKPKYVAHRPFSINTNPETDAPIFAIERRAHRPQQSIEEFDAILNITTQLITHLHMQTKNKIALPMNIGGDHYNQSDFFAQIGISKNEIVTFEKLFNTKLQNDLTKNKINEKFITDKLISQRDSAYSHARMYLLDYLKSTDYTIQDLAIIARLSSSLSTAPQVNYELSSYIIKSIEKLDSANFSSNPQEITKLYSNVISLVSIYAGNKDELCQKFYTAVKPSHLHILSHMESGLEQIISLMNSNELMNLFDAITIIHTEKEANLATLTLYKLISENVDKALITKHLEKWANHLLEYLESNNMNTTHLPQLSYKVMNRLRSLDHVLWRKKIIQFSNVIYNSGVITGSLNDLSELQLFYDFINEYGCAEVQNLCHRLSYFFSSKADEYFVKEKIDEKFLAKGMYELKRYLKLYSLTNPSLEKLTQFETKLKKLQYSFKDNNNFNTRVKSALEEVLGEVNIMKSRIYNTCNNTLNSSKIMEFLPYLRY